jgi:iron complex outermembrane receptor protein
MRGFSSTAVNNTLVLLDGQKLNNPTQAAPDISSIAMADIERVEIIQGSAGVLYGDQATGGVINIITKRPQQRSGNLEVGFGNQDWESYRGSIGETFANGLGYRLSAEKRLTDNYRDNNEASYDNVLARGDYTQALLKFFVEAQRVNDDMRLPGSLTPTQIQQNRKQTTRPNEYTNIDTDRYRVGGEITIAPQWTLALEYSYRDADSKGLLFGSEFTDATTVKAFTPRVVGNIDMPFGPAVATFGYDGQSSEYRSTLTFSHIEQHTDDIYAQLVVPVYTDVVVTAGARHSTLDQENKISGSTNDDSETVTTLGVSWQVVDSTRLFVRRDEGFRWANADDNGSTLPGVEFLDPQTSTSYETGVNWKGGAVETDVVIYRLNTDDELLYDQSAGSFGANVNLPKLRRDGVNVELRWAALDSLSLRASAGYVDAEYRAGTFDGNTVPQVAKRTGSIGVDWQICPVLGLYVDAQYNGRRYRSGDDPNIIGKLGGYTVYNANLRWQLERWYATVRVNNLTAKEYNGSDFIFISAFGNFESGYPAAERQTIATVGYKF